jgi:hypothetical protein
VDVDVNEIADRMDVDKKVSGYMSADEMDLEEMSSERNGSWMD